MFKRLTKVLAGVFVIYLILAGLLFTFQRHFIYYPAKIETYPPTLMNNLNAEVIRAFGLEWLYLSASRDTSVNKMLVYFHGNGGTAFGRIAKAEYWREQGFDVVLAEYPGYGTNRGEPSESSFYKAGRVIINRMQELYPEKGLFLYGESIGSGTATQMATEYDEQALIIEAGFSSMTDVASNHYFYMPVSLLLKDRFDNVAKINDIGSKLYVIHGMKDNIVQFNLGKNLFEAYEGEKQFFAVPSAGHNDIYNVTDITRIISRIKK